MVSTVTRDPFMHVWEFAQLTSAVHHAVWKAAAEHRIDWIPVSDAQPNSFRRYHREQVLAIAAGLEAVRG